MTRTHVRRAAFAVAGAGGVVLIICGLAGSHDVAIGTSGVVVVALVVALFESFRAAAVQSRALEHRLVQLTKKLEKRDRGARSAADSKVLASLDGKLRGVRNAIDQAPSQIIELQRKYDQLVTSPHPMPGFGSWAATVPTVLAIVDEVLTNPGRQTIVECGSGSSTVWVAAALAHRNAGGQVISLEHDGDFARLTRSQLEAHGLSQWATVIDAPLVPTDLPDRPTQPWYDVAGLAAIDTIDILFVDGPPGNTAPLARFPAFPLLRSRLRSGSWVILDDTDRAAERTIRDGWAALTSDPEVLCVVRSIGRSTLMELRSAPV